MSNSNNNDLSQHPLYIKRSHKDLLEIDRLSIEDRSIFRYTIAELIHLSVQNRIARDNAYAFLSDRGLDKEFQSYLTKQE